MPPLASDLVEATRRYLYSGYNDEMNRLSGAVDATTATINLGFDPIGVVRGTVVAVDLEEMYVWSINQRQLTVQRAINGSVGATHADASVVYVKPKFSPFRILVELNNELRDLSSPDNGLFRILTADITYNPVNSGYDLPGDIISIHEVRYAEYIGKSYPKLGTYEFVRNMPTGDFGSGSALLLKESATPGRIVHVKYRSPFGILTGLTSDVVVDSGLPSTATDIPPMGAALRLAVPREIKRNFTEAQPEPRRAEEVPPGAVAASPRGLAALRLQRIRAEAARLAAQYPITHG